MSGVGGEDSTGGLKLKIKFSRSLGFASDLVHNSGDSRVCDFMDAATNQPCEQNNIRCSPLNLEHNFNSAEQHSPHFQPSCPEVLGDGSYTYNAIHSSVGHGPASQVYTNSQNDEHDGRATSSADQHSQLHLISAAQSDKTMNKQTNMFGWQQVDHDPSGVEQHTHSCVDARYPSVGGFNSGQQSKISIGARGYFVPPASPVPCPLAPVQRGSLLAATHEGGIFSSWRFMNVGSRGQAHRPRLPRLTAPGLIMPSSYQNEMVNNWHLRQFNERQNNDAVSPEEAVTLSNSNIASAHVRATGSDTVPDTEQGEYVNGWKHRTVDINENKDKNENTNQDAVVGHEKNEEDKVSFDEEPMSPFEINCGLGLSDEINFSTPPHSPGKEVGIVRVTLLPNENPLCPWIVNESPKPSPCKPHTTSVQGHNSSPNGSAIDSNLNERFSSEKGITRIGFHCDDQDSNILATEFISSRDQFSVSSENSTPSPAFESLPSPANPQPSPSCVSHSRDQPMDCSANFKGQLKSLSSVLERETSSNMRHSPEDDSNLVQSVGGAEKSSQIGLLHRLSHEDKALNALREAVSPARHDLSASTTETGSSMNRNNLSCLDLCNSVEQLQKDKEKEDKESADHNLVSICTQMRSEQATKKKKRNRKLLVQNPGWCRCEQPLFAENEDRELEDVSGSHAALPSRCKGCWQKLRKQRLQKKRKHTSDSSVISSAVAIDSSSSKTLKKKRIHIQDVWCRCQQPEAHIPEGSVAEMCKTCCRRLSKKWKKLSAAKWCKCDRPMLSKWVPEQQESVAESDSLYLCTMCGRGVSKDREECGVKVDQISPPGDHSYSLSPFSPESATKVKFVSFSFTPCTPANQRPSLPVSSGQQTLLMPITGLPSTTTNVVVFMPKGANPNMNISNPNFVILRELSPSTVRNLPRPLAGPLAAPVPQSHLQIDGTVEPPSGIVFYVNSGSNNLSVSPSQLKVRSLLNESVSLASSSSSLADWANILRTDDMNSRMNGLESSSTEPKLSKKSKIVYKGARPLPNITKSCHVVLEKMNEGLETTALCPVQCRQHVLKELCKDGKLDDCDLSLIHRIVLEKINEKCLIPSNRKRTFLRKHKLQEEKMAKEEEERQWLASQAMSNFSERMSQSSNDATKLRIKNGNITYMGNTSLPQLSKATQVLHNHSMYGQTPTTPSTISPPLISSSSQLPTTSFMTSPLLISSSSQLSTTSSMTSPLLVSSSSQLSMLPSMLKLPPLNSVSPSTSMIITTCSSSSTGQQMPPKKNKERLVKDKDGSNWMKMCQFNVKYYVFQSDNRAFFVPFFKRKGRKGKIQGLDAEDYTYVTEAVADLLAEETSCARMLQYPESLQHKGVRRTMAPTMNTDTTASTKAFVAPTLGAEDLDLVSLIELVNSKDFSRLVQRTSRMSQSTYLKLIGEKLAMYLGLDHSSRWIQSLARKIVNKKTHGKKVKQNKKQLEEKMVLTKGISIEMDYALEEGDHMEDDVDVASSKQTVCEDSCASEYEGVDTTNVFEDFVPATSSGQKTGSYVCEEEFAQQDRKPLLSDLMQMVPVSAPLSFDQKTPVVGFPSIVPLPNGFEQGQPAPQVSAEVPGQSEMSHFVLDGTERKPLLGELLAVSVMSTAASSLGSSFQQHNTLAIEKPKESLQSSQCFDQTLFACVNVKLEPKDDDYANAWASQNTEQTLAQQTGIPFISNATFGKDAVQIDDDPGRASVGFEEPSASLPPPSFGLLPPASVILKMEPQENYIAEGVPMITCLASKETTALLTQSDYAGLSVGDSISSSFDGQCNNAFLSSLAEEMPLITVTMPKVEAGHIHDNDMPVSHETQSDAENNEPFLKISAVASGEAAALWQNDSLSPQEYDSFRGVSQAPVVSTLSVIPLDLSVSTSVTNGNTLEIQKREIEQKKDDLFEENIAGSRFEEDEYNEDDDGNDNFEENADVNVDQLPHGPESMLSSLHSSFSVVSDSQGEAIPHTSNVKPLVSSLGDYHHIQLPLVLPAVTSESTDTQPVTRPLLTNVDSDMLVELTQAPSVSCDFTDSLPDTKPLLTPVSGVQHISVPLALPIDTPVAVAQSQTSTVPPAQLGVDLLLVKKELQDHAEFDSSLLAHQTVSYTESFEQEELHLKIPVAVDTSASVSNMTSTPLFFDATSFSNLDQESANNIRSLAPILGGQSSQANTLSPFHALEEGQCNKTKLRNLNLRSPKHKRKRYPYSFSAERKRPKKKAPEASIGLSKRIHPPPDQMNIPAAVDTPAGRVTSDAMCETQMTNSNATRAGSELSVGQRNINIQSFSGSHKLGTSIIPSGKGQDKTTIPDADKQKHIISVFLGSHAVLESELPIPLVQQKKKKSSDAAPTEGLSSSTSESFRVSSSHPPSKILQKTVINDNESTMKKDISPEQPQKDTVLNTFTKSVAKPLASDRQTDFVTENKGICDLHVSEKLQTAEKDIKNFRDHSEECSVKESLATAEETISLLSPWQTETVSTEREITAEPKDLVPVCEYQVTCQKTSKKIHDVISSGNTTVGEKHEDAKTTHQQVFPVFKLKIKKPKITNHSGSVLTKQAVKKTLSSSILDSTASDEGNVTEDEGNTESDEGNVTEDEGNTESTLVSHTLTSSVDTNSPKITLRITRTPRRDSSVENSPLRVLPSTVIEKKTDYVMSSESKNDLDAAVASEKNGDYKHLSEGEIETVVESENEVDSKRESVEKIEAISVSQSKDGPTVSEVLDDDEHRSEQSETICGTENKDTAGSSNEQSVYSEHSVVNNSQDEPFVYREPSVITESLEQDRTKEVETPEQRTTRSRRRFSVRKEESPAQTSSKLPKPFEKSNVSKCSTEKKPFVYLKVSQKRKRSQPHLTLQKKKPNCAHKISLSTNVEEDLNTAEYSSNTVTSAKKSSGYEQYKTTQKDNCPNIRQLVYSNQSEQDKQTPIPREERSIFSHLTAVLQGTGMQSSPAAKEPVPPSPATFGVWTTTTVPKSIDSVTIKGVKSTIFPPSAPGVAPTSDCARINEKTAKTLLRKLNLSSKSSQKPTVLTGTVSSLNILEEKDPERLEILKKAGLFVQSVLPINSESRTRSMSDDSKKDYASNAFETGYVQESMKGLELDILQDEKMGDTPAVETKADCADSSCRVVVNKDNMGGAPPVESLNKTHSSKKASTENDLIIKSAELRRISQSPVVVTSEIKSEPAVDREGIFSRLIGLHTSTTETHNLETKSTAQNLTKMEVSEAGIKIPLTKINASGLLSRLKASISSALTSAKASVSIELASVQEGTHSTPPFSEMNKEPATVDVQESTLSTSAPSDKSNSTLKSAVVKPRSSSSRTLRSRGKSSQVSKEALPKQKLQSPSLSSSSEVLPPPAKVARRSPRKTRYQHSKTPPEQVGLQYSPYSTLLLTQNSEPLQNSPAPSFTESLPASTAEDNSPITKSLQTLSTVTEPNLSVAQSAVTVAASPSLENLATPTLPSLEVSQAKTSKSESVETSSASESIQETSALELTASPNSRDSQHLSKSPSRVIIQSQSKSASPVTSRRRSKRLKNMPNKSPSGAITSKGKMQPASPVVQSEEPTATGCLKFFEKNNSELDNGEASTTSLISSSFSDGVLLAKEFTKGKVTNVSSSNKIGLFAFLSSSTANSSEEGPCSGSARTPTSNSKANYVVESVSNVKAQEASESERARSFFDCLPQGLMNAWKK